jgi:hypothetical protein
VSASNHYGPGGYFNLQAKIKWEALRRHPEFQWDCDKADSTKEKEKVAQKWGLKKLLGYNNPIWDPLTENYPFIFTKRFSSVKVLYGKTPVLALGVYGV